MDKRFELNFKVKEQIVNALLDLMKEKKYDEISISEITKRAGVSRVSYYRNYNSKEDILTSYIDSIFEDFLERTKHLEKSDIYSHVFCIFECSSSYSQFALQLHEANLSNILIERFNHFLFVILGVNIECAKEKFRAYIIAGALFNILLEWIKAGMKESYEQIAHIFCEIIQIQQ